MSNLAQLKASPIPRPDLTRYHRPVAPEFIAGTPLVTGVPISTFVPVAGAQSYRLRLLFTAPGVLSFFYHRPPPDVATVYTVQDPANVPVVGGTELALTLYPQGECYLEIIFTPAGNGVVSFFDQMQSDAPYAQTDGRMQVVPYYWDPNTLQYVVATSGGGLAADVNITNPSLVVSSRFTHGALAPTAVVVGVVSAQAVAANANRTGLKLRNLSVGTQRISLAYGQAAVLDQGDTLYVQDTFSLGDYDFTTAAVQAIASSGGAVLAIQEMQ